MKTWIRIVILVLVVLLIIGVVMYRLTMPGLLLVLRFEAAKSGEVSTDVSVRDAKIRKNNRSIPVHVYEPDGNRKGTILMIHGVHYDGYNEERLVGFAKLLAGLGFAVVTPEIVDLKNYNIQYGAVQDIKEAVVWTLDKSGLVRKEQKIKLFGFSFAGGLCISVAAQTTIRDRIQAIFSFGGHGNMDRVMRYLGTGIGPDGSWGDPHIYGQAVLARQYASRLVPPQDVESFKKALHHYLKGEIKETRAVMQTLTSHSKQIVYYCLNRKNKKMTHSLKKIASLHRSHVALSPTRLPRPTAPLYLLHGSEDNVIPPLESVELHRWASTEIKTRLLISPLISHVELGDKQEDTLGERWKLIRFFTELLR